MNRSTCKALTFILGFALTIGNLTGVSYAAQLRYEPQTGGQLESDLPSESMLQTSYKTESYEEDGTQADSTEESPTNTADATDPTASTEIKYVLSILYGADNYVKAGKSVSLEEVLQYFEIGSATVVVDTYDIANLQYSDGTITFIGTVGAEVNYDFVLKETGSGSTNSYNLKISCTTTESELLTNDTVVITTKETSFTYSGSAITPEVTVKYNGSELKESTDYSVTYANNINAGTGIIYVKGLPATSVDKKGYIGTVSKTFTINKADFKPTVNELTYNTTEQNLVSIDSKYKDSVKFKLETDSDYSSTIPKGKNAGTYRVYYKVTGPLDDNYNVPSGATTENYVSVKISPVKATLSITGKSETKSYTGSELSVTGYSKLSIECEEFNKAGYKTGYTTSDFKYFSNNIESQPTAKGTTVGTYYMGLDPEDFRNTNTNFEITFVIVKDGSLTISDSKETMIVTHSPVTKVYDGKSYGITLSVKDSSGNSISNAEKSYRLSSSTTYSNNHPTCRDVGTYNIIYKVTADGYDDVYGSETVTITPKSVSLNWPTSYSGGSVTPTVSGISGDSLSATAFVTSSDSTSVTFSGELTGSDCKNYSIASNKSKKYTVKTSSTISSTSSGTTTKSSTTSSGTTSTTKTTGTTGTTTSSKSTTSGGTTSSSSSKTAGSTSSSTSSSSSSGSKSSGSTGSSLSDLDTSSDSDTGSSSSASLPGTGLMTMDELNAAANDIANGGTGKSTSDLSSLLAENAVDEADLYEDDEDYYYDDDDYYEDDYYVDYDIYDSDGMMTYGRMVHLADPERYPVILAITLSILILCLAAGIVFLILSIRKKSSDTH